MFKTVISCSIFTPCSRGGVLIIIFALIFGQLSPLVEALQCKDESGNNVDWFVGLKLPKDENQNGAEAGKVYVYSTSASTSTTWTRGRYLIDDSRSVLGRTLLPIYSSGSTSNYMLYNDQNPHDNKSAQGHSKGVLHFDKNTGFWLMHSVPKFPNDPREENKYEYPSNGLVNGQSFMCISIDPAGALPDILDAFLFIRPKVYASETTGEAESRYPAIKKILKRKWIKSGTKRSTIRTIGGTQIVLFRKSPKTHIEIYQKLIAQQLKTNLLVETWRRGAGGILDSSCNSTYHVQNVLSVDVNTPKVPQNWDNWPYTEDHSKWAVGVDRPYYCIGDLNRVKSQYKRGGGAMCMLNKRMWKIINKSVNDIEPCPRRRPKKPGSSEDQSMEDHDADTHNTEDHDTEDHDTEDHDTQDDNNVV